MNLYIKSRKNTAHTPQVMIEFSPVLNHMVPTEMTAKININISYNKLVRLFTNFASAITPLKFLEHILPHNELSL